jgi:hypothetical protein
MQAVASLVLPFVQITLVALATPAHSVVIGALAKCPLAQDTITDLIIGKVL